MIKKVNCVLNVSQVHTYLLFMKMHNKPNRKFLIYFHALSHPLLYYKKGNTIKFF